MKIRNQTCSLFGCDDPATRISHGSPACAQHGDLRDKQANASANCPHEGSRRWRHAHSN